LLERYLDFLEVSFIADNRYRYFVIISWKEWKMLSPYR
jgi:hypothetical protein